MTPERALAQRRLPELEAELASAGAFLAELEHRARVARVHARGDDPPARGYRFMTTYDVTLERIAAARRHIADGATLIARLKMVAHSTDPIPTPTEQRIDAWLQQGRDL